MNDAANRFIEDYSNNIMAISSRSVSPLFSIE
jgi:hypothetical protein